MNDTRIWFFFYFSLCKSFLFIGMEHGIILYKYDKRYNTNIIELVSILKFSKKEKCRKKHVAKNVLLFSRYIEINSCQIWQHNNQAHI